MKKRLAEERIAGPIKEHESGVKTGDGCRGLIVSQGACRNWRMGTGLDINEAKRMRKLKLENAELKRSALDRNRLN